jgi:hypothetical protein
MERDREWDERRKRRAGLKQKHEDDETIVHNMNTLRRHMFRRMRWIMRGTMSTVNDSLVKMWTTVTTPMRKKVVAPVLLLIHRLRRQEGNVGQRRKKRRRN